MSTSDPLVLSLAWSLLVLLASASVVVTAASHVCVHLHLRGRGRRRLEGSAPPISVLKPLKGADEELYENLASIAAQDYPGPFEIVLGAADADDPALEVAQRLRRSHPDVAIRVVPGRHGPGLNPKVANLAALEQAARYPYLLVSDSNVRVSPSYLRETAAELVDERVGLVTNVLAGVGEQSLGAALENAHLNGFVAGAVCGADLMARHPCVVGKSMLLSRRALERVGGWSSVRDVLGEDYLLGVAVKRAGFRVVLCPHVIGTVNRGWTVSRFVSRHLRWSQMRRWIAPLAYALEPLLNPVPWLLALVGLAGFGWTPPGLNPSSWVTLVLGMVALKVASDALLAWRLRGRLPSLGAASMVPLKDVLVLGLWAVAWVRRSVEWRGNRMKIGPGSALFPMRGQVRARARARARAQEIVVAAERAVDEAA